MNKLMWLVPLVVMLQLVSSLQLFLLGTYPWWKYGSLPAKMSQYLSPCFSIICSTAFLDLYLCILTIIPYTWWWQKLFSCPSFVVSTQMLNKASSPRWNLERLKQNINKRLTKRISHMTCSFPACLYVHSLNW